MPPAERTDWTTGPAKFVAAGVLGGAALVGIVWSIAGRVPRPVVVAAPAERIVGDSGQPIPLNEQPTPSGVNVVQLINVNTASSAELDLLPGVGPATAAKIIADRDANGPFASLEDLQRVSGIGPRTAEGMRGLVTFE